MSTCYEAPKEVRDLEKLINNFAFSNGLNIKDVFRDFLLYAIKQFSLPDSPALTDWRYSEEQEESFQDMFIAWIRIMDDQIKKMITTMPLVIYSWLLLQKKISNSEGNFLRLILWLK